MNNVVALLQTESEMLSLECKYFCYRRLIFFSIWPFAHIFDVILHAVHLAYFVEICLQQNNIHVIKSEK